MSDPTGDYQQGYFDGISKAQELVAAVTNDYRRSGGVMQASVLNALDKISELLDSALHPPPAV